MTNVEELMRHIRSHYDRHEKLADYFMKGLNQADENPKTPRKTVEQLERDFGFNNTMAYILADILEKAAELGVAGDYRPERVL